MYKLCCSNESSVLNQNSESIDSNFFLEKSNELDNATWNNTTTYIPDVKFGKVIKVYDGDTITIVAKPYRNEPVYRFSVRLKGIDAPEMRSKDENERNAAKIVQQKLSDLVLNKYVRLFDLSLDKYGRLLCNVLYNNIIVNAWMLDHNYAVKYTGKKKTSPPNWLIYIQNTQNTQN